LAVAGSSAEGAGVVVTVQRDGKELEARSKGAVYQGGSEAVFAVLIAGGIGYWLDGYFDSAPIGLLIGIAIGFASFTLRLIRLGKEMQRRYSDETEELKEPKNKSE
jgi:F0F1-type ATP synthase assembly protein I